MTDKHAVCYVRVSTEEQTVQNQIRVLDTWAKSNGYHVLDVFEDSAVSGKVPAMERPGFQQMVQFIGENHIDAVLVYELSRIGRTFYDTLDSIKRIEQYAPLISCSPREGFLQTTEPSIRKLLLSILTWVAERERELLVQRTKDGMARAKAEGRLPGRPRKQYDRDAIIHIMQSDVSKAKAAKALKMSKATLYSIMAQVNGEIAKAAPQIEVRV